MRTSELRVKEAINLADGRRLGPIADLEIDVETGRLTALVLPGPRRVLRWFGREEDVVVPWNDIERIGEDVILLRLPAVPAGDGGRRSPR